MTAFVHLSDNDLSGAIPTELGKWSDLTVLELDGNLFDGTLPSEIGLLTGLGTCPLREQCLDPPQFCLMLFLFQWN